MFKITKYRWIFSITLVCFMTFNSGVFDTTFASENLAIKKKQKIETPAIKEVASTCAVANYTAVKPLDVVADPVKYLNQNITMNATFDKFSILGLDYKPALRENANYIGFLIQRDDVVDHDVPLSEMKLFLKRDYAEKFIDLETGDKIQIKGKVFAAALGDPWIDVNEIVIIQKAKTPENSKETTKK